jgi:hypothetical protein
MGKASLGHVATPGGDDAGRTVPTQAAVHVPVAVVPTVAGKPFRLRHVRTAPAVLRDQGQKAGHPLPHAGGPVERVVRVRLPGPERGQVTDGVPHGPPRDQSSGPDLDGPGISVGRLREGRRARIGRGGDHDQTAAVLRHPVIGGVHHPLPHPVPRFGQCVPERPVEGLPKGRPKQARDVLEHDKAGAKVSNVIDEDEDKAVSGIADSVPVAEPGKSLAGRAPEQDVHLAGGDPPQGGGLPRGEVGQIGAHRFDADQVGVGPTGIGVAVDGAHHPEPGPEEPQGRSAGPAEEVHDRRRHRPFSTRLRTNRRRSVRRTVRFRLSLLFPSS